MLPRVAFTLVTAASMLGAILTGLRHGWEGWPVLALLLGSQVWKVFYLRPSVRLRPDQQAREYAEAMLKLHMTWQKVLTPLALVLILGNFGVYLSRSMAIWPWALGGLSPRSLALM